MSPIQFPSKRMNDCFNWEFNGTKNSFSAMVIALNLWQNTLYSLAHTKTNYLRFGKFPSRVIWDLFGGMCQNVSDIPHLSIYCDIIVYDKAFTQNVFTFKIKIFLCPSYSCPDMKHINFNYVSYFIRWSVVGSLLSLNMPKLQNFFCLKAIQFSLYVESF